MKISVGIPTYNRPETIKMCLSALEKQTKKPHEVIIIDSSDNDETKKIVKKFKLKIVYKHQEDKIARNTILRLCKGDVIAFLDDDAIPKKDWLENIEKGYSFSKVVGVTGPAINSDMSMKPTEKILKTSKNQNFFTSYGDIRCESRRWIPPKPVFCSVMLGANMSFLVKELREIGGFDEFYGSDGAIRIETDPQIALIKKGYRFVYMPKAFVFHLKYEKGGARQSNPKKNYFYSGGVHHRYMSDKYFPKWKSRLSWIFWSINPPCLWLAF
jgi:glycosyltransferase involved in cell wall biosynthesis